MEVLVKIKQQKAIVRHSRTLNNRPKRLDVMIAEVFNSIPTELKETAEFCEMTVALDFNNTVY